MQINAHVPALASDAAIPRATSLMEPIHFGAGIPPGKCARPDTLEDAIADGGSVVCYGAGLRMITPPPAPSVRVGISRVWDGRLPAADGCAGTP